MEKEIFFEHGKIIVSKTDLQGRITYGNSYFIELSGYSEKELMFAPHNIIRHADMPALIFKLLWQNIQEGREIFAYVKNRTKNGAFYWVFANVTPSFDMDGKTIGYLSVRRKPQNSALDVIKELYSKLLEAEKRGGMDESQRLLEQTLKNEGKCYEEFILSI